MIGNQFMITKNTRRVMMNKLFTFLFTMMFLIIGCSGDDPISGGVDPEHYLQ